MARTVWPQEIKSKNILLWYWGRRGGGAHYLLELAKAMSKDPDIVLHISMSKQCDLYHEIKKLGLPGIEVDTYHNASSALASLRNLAATRRAFFDYLKDNKIDTVICTMQHLWNPFMLSAIRQSHCRYIVTVHDASLHNGERLALYQWWLDWEIRRADGYVVLSDHVKRELRARHRLPRDRIVVAPCGPFNQFSTARRLVRFPVMPPRRLLFFGRIIAYKGLDLLLEAYRELKLNYSNLSLTICGAGDLSPYEAKLRDLRDVTVDNRYIPECEVTSILEKADLIVLPYREASQSGVMLLAEAAGVPVVGTPAGALMEQIVPGTNGLIAEAVTAEALNATIARLLNDLELYGRCIQGIGGNADTRWSEAVGRIKTFLQA
jgi:glycosyltransferase involved in cell wall biosynthesis